MYSESFWSSLKTGAFFGALFCLALCAFSPYESLLSLESVGPEWLKQLSELSLLAGSLWGSFLFFNRQNPDLPAHFPHHLLVGVAFAFSAAMFSALGGYLYFNEHPIELEQMWNAVHYKWMDAGLTSIEMSRQPESYAYASPLNFAVAKYSSLFFTAFSLSMLLGTVSCIWECSKAEAN